jgi:hypothetical protein
MMDAGDLFPKTTMPEFMPIEPRSSIAQLTLMTIENAKAIERMANRFDELDALVRSLLHMMNKDTIPDE